MKNKEMGKKQAEKVLATVVMGMNLVNAAAPAAILATTEQTMNAASQPVRSEAAPLDYAVLPQLADVVDRAIFARAEAGSSYDGNASVASMGSGDTQNITVGQSGTVSTMSGGTQTISSGGTGTVSTIKTGNQTISSGGTGIVNMLSGIFGSQAISSGGSGMVSTMSAGEQLIYSGGTGEVGTMSRGSQIVSSSGIGRVDLMLEGKQEVLNAVGSVTTMREGAQNVSGGTGTITTMEGGRQNITSGGSSGGVGIVTTMNGGNQNVFDEAVGIVNTLNSGNQNIYSGGFGAVRGTLGGEQHIASGGTGYVEYVTSNQVINSGGTGIVEIVTTGDNWGLSGGQIGIANTMNGGAQVIYSGGTGTVKALNSGMQAIYSGGTAIDTVLNGGSQVVSAGGTSLDTTIKGGTMQLASGGSVSGLTISAGSLQLESIDGGSFTLDGVTTATGGIVNMTDSNVTRAGLPTYEKLTIDTLKGSGTTFIMDTDLAGEANSDKITINHADAGTHYVQIKDLSSLNDIEVTGAHQQLLITDNSGKLTFEGKDFNAGGLWDIDPTLAKGDTLGLSANDWYLTKIAKTVNNDTAVLLDATDNSYAMWRNTNDSLRSRLGSLASGSERAEGIWARTKAGRFSGPGYEGRYNLYQLGYDKADNAKSIYGMAVDYGDGTGSYADGSGKDKLRTFNLYSLWIGDNGTYTNVTARAGNLSTDMESHGDYPDKASYKQHSYSISVEYGKCFDLERGFFIEPSAQITLGRLGSIDYTTDRGANGHIDGMNSAIGRIGFVMGQKITNGNDIYLKADLLHEFAGERDLVLTSDAGGSHDILTKHNDYGDTWFELGLGGSVKLSKAGNLYGEVVRGFGGDINKKWSVNAGLRFTF